MYEFDYHKAASVEDAVKSLGAADDGKLLAGGMTLLPTMKQRLASPDVLIDLAGIDGIKGIRKEGDQIVVGAMTTHAEVNLSALVQKEIPALAELAGLIGDPQVRNRGTIGGSVANADPSADYPAALVGLNATITTNSRSIAADEFFVDVCQLADNSIRVAVTGAGGCVFRQAEMEAALDKSFSADAIEGITIDPDDFNEDIHASAEYRAHLVGVMARRAVAKIA